ncbi:MAG TPA: PIG-L deacetylase family protein [Candidatus Edwardsbacteria bacterium]|nr:PIG-L deacetylase family protein [Candidatus Edwardsbacteria bacterium]
MFTKVLVLAPHTDDGEFGCGGTIARLLAEGAEVHYAAFSSAERSLPAGVAPDQLVKELRAAMRSLGIMESRLHILDYAVRDFPEHRQAILDDLLRLKAAIGPDLVLLPSVNDTHQDHQTVAHEGFRAFKDRTILGYEIPWNNRTFNTESFVLLDKKHIDAKVAALQCYTSQLDRFYANENFVRSLAVTRGTQIGASFAEAFEVVRWVIR